MAGPVKFFSYLKTRKGILSPHEKILGSAITINSQSIIVDRANGNSDVTEAHGVVVISDGGSGFAKGCRYTKTDAATGVDGVYENIGTNTSCQFVTGGQIVPGEIALANTKILVGNGSGVAAPVTASGDVTNDNAGVFTLSATKLAEASVTLTAAQVKALFTTPITLVAAPGAGSYIDVDEVRFKLVFGTTQYAGANNVEFRLTNASGAKVTADLAAASLNSNATAYRTINDVTTEFTPVLNTPVIVTVPVANPTAGDSPVTIVVRYHVVTP